MEAEDVVQAFQVEPTPHHRRSAIHMPTTFAKLAGKICCVPLDGQVLRSAKLPKRPNTTTPECPLVVRMESIEWPYLLCVLFFSYSVAEILGTPQSRRRKQMPKRKRQQQPKHEQQKEHATGNRFSSEQRTFFLALAQKQCGQKRDQDRVFGEIAATPEAPSVRTLYRWK